MQYEDLLSEQHRSFLNKRGITDTVITAFSISTADVPELRLQNAIVIPVRNVDGTHAFNKYRRDPMEGNVKPKYLFERGGKVTLFGADRLVAHESQATHNKVIITEGELDTLVCWSQNIPAVSSTAGASSFQEEWASLLKCYDVYVCFDNDEAGHKGAIKILELLPEAKVIFVPKNIPDVKDISDYVARGGDLHTLMQTAKTYTSLDEVERERQQIAAQWGDYSFHDLYIARHKEKQAMTLPTKAGAPRKQSDDRLERAKSVDGLTLLPFSIRGRYPVTTCLWHNDHDPSFTWYKRSNSGYCHVCGKYADSVDIVQARDGVDFKTAIKVLLREI